MFKLGKKLSVQILDENIQDFRLVKTAGEINSNPETCGIFLAFVNSEKLLDFSYIAIHNILEKVQVPLVGDNPKILQEGEEDG